MYTHMYVYPNAHIAYIHLLIGCIHYIAMHYPHLLTMTATRFSLGESRHRRHGTEEMFVCVYIYMYDHDTVLHHTCVFIHNHDTVLYHVCVRVCVYVLYLPCIVYTMLLCACEATGP